MYYPYFISYMVFGLFVALIVFAWALKNGQFSDQQRARFLPLSQAGPQKSVRANRASRVEVYALFGLVIVGLCTSFAVVIFALWRAN